MLDVTGNKAVIGDISVLKNCPLTNININGCTGITGKFADLPLSVITLSTSTIDGDIAELTCPNLTTLGLYDGSGYGNIDDIQQASLEVLEMPGSKVGGNISGLLKYNSLRSLTCSFNLEGSIESFVENACTLGRVSGNCNINAASTYIAKVTSNSNPIPASNAVFITFTATGANVSGFGGDRTYNKSTGTWS